MTGDIDETSIPLSNETIDKQQKNVYFDINTKYIKKKKLKEDESYKRIYRSSCENSYFY